MKRKLELTEENIRKLEASLWQEEREPSTVENYLRSLRRFAAWAGDDPVNKETAAAWKAALAESGYAPVTINAMLAAVNKFFVCMGYETYKVRYLRIQRRLFRAPGRELTQPEYKKLVETAKERGTNA